VQAIAPLTDLQLETLFETPDLPRSGLPEPLARRYGGDLGFRAPVLYGNLVSTVDGITALDEDTPPAVVACHSTADRFVMGLLRACADAILIGASTLRAEPRHLWRPEKVYADGAPAFAELRRALGLAERPRLVLVTASGQLDPALPALADGATVLTTRDGAGRLSGSSWLTIRALGDGPLLEGRRIVAAIRKEGHRRVLTEGGPHLIGTLLKAEGLDELFLTISPALAGDRLVAGRRGIVEGARFDAGTLRAADLLSVRRHGSHLFLRYRLETAQP
jgi:riboflavin biosynthesis pyrimidine reductase